MVGDAAGHAAEDRGVAAAGQLGNAVGGEAGAGPAAAGVDGSRGAAGSDGADRRRNRRDVRRDSVRRRLEADAESAPRSSADVGAAAGSPAPAAGPLGRPAAARTGLVATIGGAVRRVAGRPRSPRCGRGPEHARVHAGGCRSATSPHQGHTRARPGLSGFTLDRRNQGCPRWCRDLALGTLIGMTQTQHQRAVGVGRPRRRPVVSAPPAIHHRPQDRRRRRWSRPGHRRRSGAGPRRLRHLDDLRRFRCAAVRAGLAAAAGRRRPGVRRRVAARARALVRAAGARRRPGDRRADLAVLDVLLGPAVLAAGHRRRHRHHRRPQAPRGELCAHPSGSRLGRIDATPDAATGTSGRSGWGQQAGAWGAAGRAVGRPGSRGRAHRSGTRRRRPAPQSPFDRPAFWDEDRRHRPSQPATRTRGGPTGRADRTPPAWDPLGVAPFAWDLPEPAPAPEPPPAQQHRGRSVVGRVTMGARPAGRRPRHRRDLRRLVAADAGPASRPPRWRWSRPGCLIGSLRGRGHGLIGPGIFLSLRHPGAGRHRARRAARRTASRRWAPDHHAGRAVGVRDQRRSGRAGPQPADRPGRPDGGAPRSRCGPARRRVIVPQDANVEVTCSANAGDVDCLGQHESGLRRELTATNQGSSDQGTIDLEVHVGAGQAEVVYG